MGGQWYGVSVAAIARMRQLGRDRTALAEIAGLDAAVVDEILDVTGPRREPEERVSTLEKLSTALDWPAGHLWDVVRGLSVVCSGPFPARTVTISGFTAADALRRAADWLDDYQARDGYVVDGVTLGETAEEETRVVIHLGYRPPEGARPVLSAVPAAPRG